ncbi:Uncharacterised protein [uncultured archaeon]|nr:Uncharacterised protein [uncultured archaeon]
MSLSKHYRGQYFSMDAIVASVIFVLALSLLASHWFALRAQNETRSSILQEDADRLSETLLQPADPWDWYVQPQYARTAGLALNGSPVGVLNYTLLIQAGSYLNPPRSDQYVAAQNLMATPADFYITINTSMPNAAGHLRDQLPLIVIGHEPVNPRQVVQVSRGVVIPVHSGPQTYYHYGIMTLTLWTNRSNI